MMSKLNILFAVIITLIAFLIYFITLAPDLQFTDSGELAGVCVTLGVAHPSGYPLFTILGHIWSHLPLPFSKIYSLNILSGIYIALSVCVFYFI